jgi:hypothetical protein
MCSVRYYAIPYVDGDTSLLTSLDYNSFVDWEASVEAQDDVYVATVSLGFWCAACPSGANCTDEGTTIEDVTAMAGYFMGFNSNGTQFLECLNDACGEGGECYFPYEGDFCTECADDLVATREFTCETCPDLWLLILIMIVLLLMVIASLLAFVRSNYTNTNPPMRVSGLFKITMSAFQANATAITLFAWSDSLRDLFRTQDDVSSLGMAYLNLGCLQSGVSSYVAETIVFFLGPVFLLLFVTMLVYVLWKDQGLKFYDVLVGVSVVMFYCIQPSSTYRAALLMSCVQLGPQSDDYFLSSDLSIRCWTSSEHLFLLIVLGIPMILVYVIAIPYMFFRTLDKNHGKCKIVSDFVYSQKSGLKLDDLITRRNTAAGPPVLDEGIEIEMSKISRQRSMSILTDNVMNLGMHSSPITRNIRSRSQELSVEEFNFQKNFGFLFLGYMDDSFTWEVNVIMRKASLYLTAAIFAWDIRMQSMLAMLILFIATIAQAKSKPYREEFMSTLELVSLYNSCFTFFLGQFTLDAGDLGASYSAVASVLALLSNVLWMLVVILMFFYLIRTDAMDAITSRKSEKEQEDIIMI